MNITIKKSSNDNKIKTTWFPMEEDKLQEVCNELGIEMTTEANCYIESSMDKRFLNMLTDKNVNIDELNYLMKRFDGLSPRVTPYGVLYKNSNDPIQVYNGKQFPPYGWKESMVIVELKAKSF